MTLADWALYIVPVLSVGLAAATLGVAIWRDRNKPVLDEAQVRDINTKLNAGRDLRLLEIDNWAFTKVIPWGRQAVERFGRQGDQVQALAAELGRDVERIHLEPFPEMPPPHFST